MGLINVIFENFKPKIFQKQSRKQRNVSFAIHRKVSIRRRLGEAKIEGHVLRIQTSRYTWLTPSHTSFDLCFPAEQRWIPANDSVIIFLFVFFFLMLVSLYNYFAQQEHKMYSGFSTGSVRTRSYTDTRGRGQKGQIRRSRWKVRFMISC